MCVCVCRSIENIYIHTQADKYKLCTCVYTLEGNSCVVSATACFRERRAYRKCQQKSLGGEAGIFKRRNPKGGGTLFNVHHVKRWTR